MGDNKKKVVIIAGVALAVLGIAGMIVWGVKSAATFVVGTGVITAIGAAWLLVFPAASREQAEEIIGRLSEIGVLLKPTEEGVKSELENELASEMGRKAQEALRLFKAADQDIYHGRALHAIPKLEQALAIADIPSFHLVLGNAFFYICNYAVTLQHYHAALEGFRKGQNRPGEAGSLANLGMVLINQGDLLQGELQFRQALKIYEELGEALGQAVCLDGLGLIYLDKGDLQRAESYHRQALNFYHGIGFKLGIAASLSNLGLINLTQDKLARAELQFNQALANHIEISNRYGQAIAQGNLGIVARKKGDFELAAQCHSHALDINRQLGNRLGEASQLGNLGLTYKVQGNLSQAKQCLNQALIIQEEIGDKLGQARTFCNLGYISVQQSELPKAIEQFEQGAAIFKVIGATRELAIAEEEAARVQRAMAGN